MKPSDLLALSDIDFLTAVVKRYPEAEYLAGKAESSPEGNPVLKKEALAYKVFDSGVTVDPTAIEADRTFLGLLTLKWVLTDQYEQFTSLQSNPQIKLSRQSFDALRDYTQNILQSEEDLEFCLYSLTCNDLGKTLFLVEEHKKIIGQAAEDHDLLLHTLVQKTPDLFPAFQALLTPTQQESYVRGLGANLNLGQFVQGENLPANLAGMQAIDAKSRELRLVCELYDFAGVTGHVNPNGSIVMNEENYLAFSSAIKELTTEPQNQSYNRYIAHRGELVGLAPSTPEGFAMARLATLSRAFKPEQGAAIRNAWSKLDDEERRNLTRELNETGLDGRKAILVYYAPAVIGNAIKATGDYAAGLEYSMNVLNQVYAEARTTAPNQQGNGVITVNVNHLARQALQIPKTEAPEWKPAP